jgi:hypothetical protein
MTGSDWETVVAHLIANWPGLRQVLAMDGPRRVWQEELGRFDRDIVLASIREVRSSAQQAQMLPGVGSFAAAARERAKWQAFTKRQSTAQEVRS